MGGCQVALAFGTGENECCPPFSWRGWGLCTLDVFPVNAPPPHWPWVIRTGMGPGGWGLLDGQGTGRQGGGNPPTHTHAGPLTHSHNLVGPSYFYAVRNPLAPGVALTCFAPGFRVLTRLLWSDFVSTGSAWFLGWPQAHDAHPYRVAPTHMHMLVSRPIIIPIPGVGQATAPRQASRSKQDVQSMTGCRLRMYYRSLRYRSAAFSPFPGSLFVTKGPCVSQCMHAPLSYLVYVCMVSPLVCMVLCRIFLSPLPHTHTHGVLGFGPQRTAAKYISICFADAGK